MNNIIILSPHLDDAALTMGIFISQFTARPRINKLSVINIFGTSSYVDSKLSSATKMDEVTRLRQLEDKKFGRMCDLRQITHKFQDSFARGIPEEFECDVDHLVDPILTVISSELGSQLKIADFIFCPACIGSHVDHRITQTVAELHARKDSTVIYYEDLPYAVFKNQPLINRYQESFPYSQTLSFPGFERLQRLMLECYSTQLSHETIDHVLAWKSTYGETFRSKKEFKMEKILK